ncbi:unnamed protein product [Mytilus coruscus]|uniref:B box-type domain-containing protein n=1 Tax=Mytilus coruscus TaxID=42192 RepID=A0A6J8BET9_MYTCO|nr:unnamed protein product [Mytilus coruscus]
MERTGLEMNTTCFNHSRKYISYCSFHDMMCCQYCVSESHQYCQVQPLQEVDAKKVENDLRNLTLEFQAIENFLVKMMSKIGDQRKQCLEEIGQVRNHLQTQLENLEKKMTENISRDYENLKSETEYTMEQIGNDKIKVQMMANKLTGLKRKGTDEQYLCAVTSTKNELRAIRRSLAEVRESRALLEKNMSVHVNPNLTSFDEKNNSFGEVVIQSSASIMSYSKPLSRRRMAQETFRSETDISLKKCDTLTFPRKMRITGCVRLPGGKHVFVESHKNRLVLNESGKFRDIMPFTESPFDVCHIGHNIVAVTIPERNEVVYVDILKGIQIKSSLFFKNKCYGVDCNGECMVIGFPNNERVIVADLDGTELMSFKVRGERFTLGPCEIYTVDEQLDNVICYELSGGKRWMYPDKVRQPAGVAVDRGGQVYVFSKFNKSLYLISPYGRTSRILEDNAKEDLNDFSCLYMYPGSDELLIFSYSTQAIMYTVEG